jgi:hypothetical protein
LKSFLVGCEGLWLSWLERCPVTASQPGIKHWVRSFRE